MAKCSICGADAGVMMSMCASCAKSAPASAGNADSGHSIRCDCGRTTDITQALVAGNRIYCPSCYDRIPRGHYAPKPHGIKATDRESSTGVAQSEARPRTAWKTIGSLVAAATFALTWLYAIATWGFLLGVAFGWFPAIITAILAFFLWPLVLLAGIVVAAFLMN